MSKSSVLFEVLPNKALVNIGQVNDLIPTFDCLSKPVSLRSVASGYFSIQIGISFSKFKNGESPARKDKKPSIPKSRE